MERSSEVLIWQEKRRNNWSHADIVLYSCHQAYSNFTPIGLGWSPDTWLSSAEINKCLYRDKRNHSKGFETPLGSQKGSYVMLRNLFLLLLNKFELSSPNHVGTILQVCRDWIRANFPAPHCRWCNCIAIFNLFLISPSSRRAVSKFLLPLGDSHREIRCYQCFVGSCGLNRDFCVVYLLPCNLTSRHDVFKGIGCILLELEKFYSLAESPYFTLARKRWHFEDKTALCRPPLIFSAISHFKRKEHKSFSFRKSISWQALRTYK